MHSNQPSIDNSTGFNETNTDSFLHYKSDLKNKAILLGE